ncbi:RNA-directed DNA polymerase from mobile element jockey [Trichonephila clavipes]|nr:RNA-directed DNA polymerase from mobile element jockey [Trichonephila clavipes]
MSEDPSKFKKKRTTVRSSLTKLINKIEGKINNENEPVDQFEAFLEQLNDKESNLSLLNTLIEDCLSVDTITEDIEASEEIKEKIMLWKTKLSSKIRRINSDSIQVDTVSRNRIQNKINSLLPILSKIAEKIVHTRSNQHLIDYDILIPQQHGFRANLSTSHQLLRVVEYIKTGFANKKSTGAVFLDIQKAFDKEQSRAANSSFSSDHAQPSRVDPPTSHPPNPIFKSKSPD